MKLNNMAYIYIYIYIYIFRECISQKKLNNKNFKIETRIIKSLMEEKISSGQYDNMKLQYEIQQYDNMMRDCKQK